MSFFTSVRADPKVQMSILVVDDSPGDQQLMELHLERIFSTGVYITPAKSLKEAQEALIAARFSAVLLDLGLPDSNGIETVKTLKKHTPDVPLVVVTGNHDPQLGQEAISYGAEEFISKSNMNGEMLESALRHAIERHRANQQILDLISRHATPILIVSLQQRILFGNSAAAQLYEMEMHELLSDKFSADIHHDQKEVQTIETRGGAKNVEVQSSLITWRGEQAYSVSLYDVSDFEKTARRLEMQRDQIEALDEVKTHYMASLSHKLRTPLNAIIGFSQILKSEAGETLGREKRTEYLEDINRSGEVLLRRVESLLRINESISSEMVINTEKLDVCELVHIALEDIKTEALANGVSITTATDNDLCCAQVDRQKFILILRSLLANAIKHSPRGGEVKFRLSQGDSKVRIDLQDEGGGFVSPSIDFEDSSRRITAQYDDDKDHFPTGLSLPIINYIVKLHGGLLEVHNVGEGARVSLTLDKTA